jgi:hypothetical protein
MLTVALCALAACGHANSGSTPAVATQQATMQSPTTQGATPGASATPAAPAFVCASSAPLSSDDIALYLSVMRAAAAIVQHPTVADLAERQRAKAQAAANAKALAADQQQNGEARASADAANQEFMAAIQAAQKSGDYNAVAAAANAANAANGAVATSPVIMPPEQTPAQQAESMRVMEMDSGMADNAIVDERHIDSDRWDCITRKVEDAVPDPDAPDADGGPIVLTAQQRLDEAKYEARLAANRALLAQYIEEIRALEKIVRARHDEG